MHFEILVEDSSGARLLQRLVPAIIGPEGAPHTWRIHPYKGVGRLPAGLNPKADPAKRALLDNLPLLLKGYGRTPGVDAVVVVVDTDTRDWRAFLAELLAVANECEPRPNNIMFRLAIEEMEAWYFGDRVAIQAAYPQARQDILNRYHQDSVCGTWEMLADAVYPGGSRAIKKRGFPASGDAKHEWAQKITPHMDVEANSSPSFLKFVEGMRRLAGVIPQS